MIPFIYTLAIFAILPAVIAASSSYLIVTKEYISDNDFNTLRAQIGGTPGIVSNVPGSIVKSFTATLNDDQARAAMHHPLVDLFVSVYPASSGVLQRRDNVPVPWSEDPPSPAPSVAGNSTLLQETKRADVPSGTGNYLVRQEQTFDDLSHLKLLSRSPIGPDARGFQHEQYLFDSTLGEGITVYVLEDGMDQSNRVGHNYRVVWRLSCGLCVLRTLAISNLASFDGIFPLTILLVAAPQITSPSTTTLPNGTVLW